MFQKYIYLGNSLFESGSRPFYSSPIYTAWMYLFCNQAGCSPDCLRLFQLLFGLLTVVLITATAFRLTKQRSSAVASGLLYGLASPVLLYESDLVTASMVILVQAAALYCLIRCIQATKQNVMVLLLAGGLTGMAIGLRPNALLALPFVVLALLNTSNTNRNNTIRITSFLVGAILMVSPITISNFMKTGEFIPVTASGGSVLYSSNNFRATGLGYSPPPALTEIEAQWMQTHRADRPVEHDIFKFLAERAVGRRLSHKETSRFYTQEAVNSLKRYPAKSMMFWLKKLFYTFNAYEVLDTASLLSTSQRIHSYLPILIPGGILIVLGLFGIRYFSFYDRTLWIVLAFLLPHVFTAVVFYVNGRLRAPMFYFLAIFAGQGIITLWDMIRKRDPSVWISILILMGFASLVGYRDMGIIRHEELESRSFLSTVKALAARKSGNINRAEEMYYDAVNADPLGAVEAWMALADIHSARGNDRGKSICLNRARGIWDSDSIDKMSRDNRISEYEILMTRAKSDWINGRKPSAMMNFQKASEMFPSYPDPWFNRAVLLSQTNSDWERVIEYTNRALYQGMKLSLDSTRAHKLKLRGFESMNRTRKTDEIQKQIQWETSRVFNPDL